jgi:ubiquinol-cytochrome c reductase cytochrome c1 subunit
MLETAIVTSTQNLLKRVAFAALAAMSLAGVAHAAEEAMEPANIRVDDIASLQRGSRLFFNYCSGCHSLQYMRYSRIAEDLKLDEKDVQASLIFTGAKIGDKAVNQMPAPLAAGWFGKAPPDLSLEARAKGSDWIYHYLKSFYLDPSRPVGWNNTVFPNVSMPNPLWELQGTQVPVKAEGGEGAVEKLQIKTPGSVSEAHLDGRLGAALPCVLYVSRLAPEAGVLEGRALIIAGRFRPPARPSLTSAASLRRHDALPQRLATPGLRLGAPRSA